MTKPDDTIRVLIPLKVRKKNGRPKILPPADYRPARIKRRTRTSCVPSAAHGPGGGGWKPESSAQSAIWQSP